jgi:mycoredoxin-dependent peroxiredoxin
MCLVPLLAAVAWPLAVHAQGEPKVPPPVGPPAREPSSSPPHEPLRLSGNIGVSELAPDFELDGSLRQPVRLSRLRGTRVLLLFAESHASLAPFADAIRPLAAVDTRLVGVCHDKARTLEQAALRDPHALLTLADVTGEVSAMYGLYDFEHDATRPGLVLIDRNGTVRLALLGERLPPDDMVALVRTAFGEAP